MNLMNTLRALLIAIGAVMLAVIFQAYLKPGFIIDIANQLFLCL